MSANQWTRILMSSPFRMGIPKILDKDARVSFGVSSHNIPTAIRGSYDSTNNRFVVELRYLDGEDYVRSLEEDGATVLRLGKNSRRLLGIELRTPALTGQLPKDGFQLSAIRQRTLEKLRSAVAKLETTKGQDPQSYRLAYKAVVDNLDPLLEQSSSNAGSGPHSGKESFV
jgi:hypothetical protein